MIVVIIALSPGGARAPETISFRCGGIVGLPVRNYCRRIAKKNFIMFEVMIVNI
jgi:hypothetical protein